MTPAAIMAIVVGASGDAHVASVAAAASLEPERYEETQAEPSNRIGPPPPATPNIVVPAVHALALMTVMRTAETFLWPDPFARPEQFGARYHEAFTTLPKFDGRQPFMRWDGDPLVVNAVGHALFGSELYLRARQCRFGWGGSVAFTAATSALWEYGFEANGARPSALDLVYTPLAGAVVGETRYRVHRAAAGLAPSARGIVRALVDPFGELERAVGPDC